VAPQARSPPPSTCLLHPSFSSREAPSQARFLQRLARAPGVDLRFVDEFRTSKICRRCHGLLRAVYGQTSGGRRRDLWGVRLCEACGVFWHRDVNAAGNIGDVYLALARTGQRPGPFAYGAPLPVLPVVAIADGASDATSLSDDD
jgi:transposase